MRWISFEDSFTGFPHLRLLEIHHFYWGIAGNLTGFVWIFKASFYPWLGLLLVALGDWWVADDAWQHYRQRADPYYTSPVHDLWVWVVSLWRYLIRKER